MFKQYHNYRLHALNKEKKLLLKKYHDKIIKEHKEWICNVKILFQNTFWHFKSNEKKILYCIIYFKNESKKLCFNYEETMFAIQQIWFNFIDFFLNLIKDSMNWDINVTQQYVRSRSKASHRDVI